MSTVGLAVGNGQTTAVLPRWRWDRAFVPALLAVVAVAGTGLVRPWLSADPAGESALAVPAASQGVWPAGLREVAHSAIAADAYSFAPAPAPAPEGSWFTSTPSQGLRSTFSASGLTVGPVGGDWDLRLSLARIGRPGALVAVQAAQATGSAEGVEYRRGPALTEWYRNEARGLEQGFTVARAPSGGAGPLTLEMDAAGLTLALSADGSAVVGSTADGTAVLRYSGLSVTDATGRHVPASLAVEGQAVQLRIDDLGAAYPLAIDPWFEQAKLTAANDDARLGLSVAVSGDTAVVGAPRYETPSGFFSGAAYVFVRSGGTWIQQQRLTALDFEDGDEFGWSVAVSGDTAVVGAWRDDTPEGFLPYSLFAGSAYVFVRSGGAWTQQAKLIASDMSGGKRVGFSVAISGDTAVLGAPGEEAGPLSYRSGTAYVFVRAAGAWTQQQEIAPASPVAGDEFGDSVAVSGDTTVVGSPFDDTPDGQNAGSASVFVRSGGTWTRQQDLTASDADGSDSFGGSVAVSEDTVVVGANGDDTAGGDAGSAYAFVRSAGIWTEQQKLTASDTASGDRFGASVAVSGDTAVVGADGDDIADTDAGSASTFVRSGATWTEQQKLTASDGAIDLFGNSVAVSGDTALVGAPFDDTSAGTNAGSAYVFGPALCAGREATVPGTSGNDLLTGTPGDDVIAGFDGDDTIDGLGGNDVICGGGGDDDIGAGAGEDDVYGQNGVDVLNGGDDNDVLTGGEGDDALHGDAGADVLDGSSGADSVNGEAGVDLAYYARRIESVTVSIGDGANDGAVAENDDIRADVENLRGGRGEDTLTGDAGVNQLYGRWGDDTLNGGAGRDVLKGEEGNDALHGDAGNDTLFGGEHDDNLHGGADHDTLDGASGADTLSGDTGIDVVVYSTRSVPITASIAAGANDGASGESDDIQAGVESIRGGGSNDTLTGDAAANRLYGGIGNDTLTGNAGNDLLYGEDGNDTIDALDGPTYTDSLWCGAGSDTTSTDTRDRRSADCE